MSEREKVTIQTLRRMKEEGRKITMITAYDFPMGQSVDEAGIDVVLVGDSLGNNVLGYPNTLPVTMEEMIIHARAVTRGCKYAFVIGDMPYMSYQVSIEEAIRNAGRFMKEGTCDAIKLEGGENVCEIVRSIVRVGIPVMGHIGLTPQYVSVLGGFRAQGRTADMALKLLRDAEALQEAGVFALLLEAIPAEVGQVITKALKVPVIGIGAGLHCDGQLLIFHDLFGLHRAFTPRFAKRYVDLGQIIVDNLKLYAEEIRSAKFPEPKHEFSMLSGEREVLEKRLREG